MDDPEIIVIEERLGEIALIASKEVGDRENGEILGQQCHLQRQLVSVGKLVAHHGNPMQILQDAAVAHQVNNKTLPAIKNISVCSTMWKPKLLREAIEAYLKPRMGIQEMESDDFGIFTKKAFCAAFVNELLQPVVPGYAPSLRTVYGALAVSVKKRPSPSQGDGKVKRTRRVKEQVDEAARKEVKKVDGQQMNVSVDPTMEKVNRLFDAISEQYAATRKPVSLINLLVDKKSYGRTVENFFCFSFLVKDGQARILMDENQLPICLPVYVDTGSKDTNDQEKEYVPDPRGAAEKEDKFPTVILNLTEAKWQQWIELL